MPIYRGCNTRGKLFSETRYIASEMPVAVVPGCNSGIGYSFARLLCDEVSQSINTFKLKVGDEPVDLLLNIAGRLVG
jgi:hypothetical protein